jgi:cytochrome c oxidase assembly factor CtaG
VWRTWSFEPGVLLGIAVAALAYRRGLRSLWGRAGVGRGVRRWEAWCYLGGLGTLLVALVSPLDGLGESLFVAHMVQHLLLILVAAPLLAMGAPLRVWAWALPRAGRMELRRHAPWVRAPVRWLDHPAVAWTLHVVALWLWHLPVLYDLAVRQPWVHAAEHASFLVTGVLFWWVILPRGGALRHAHGVAILYLFTFSLQSGVLGAFLALSRRAAYGAHAYTTAAWGLTPAEDQQLAGAVMWVPGSLGYLAAALALFFLWMSAAERRAAAPARPTSCV